MAHIQLESQNISLALLGQLEKVLDQLNFLHRKHDLHVFVFDHRTANNLPDFLDMPVNGWIEIGPQPINWTHLENLPDHEQSLLLTVTTKTAFQHHMAVHLMKVLDGMLGLDEDTKQEIQTSLHEAITNAIVHGNLNMESNFSTPEAMAEFYNLIDMRLAQPFYAERYVTLHISWDDAYIEFMLFDEGAGIPTDAYTEKKEVAVGAHGMGATLIQHLSDEVSVQNSSLHLRFKR